MGIRECSFHRFQRLGLDRFQRFVGLSLRTGVNHAVPAPSPLNLPPRLANGSRSVNTDPSFPLHAGGPSSALLLLHFGRILCANVVTVNAHACDDDVELCWRRDAKWVSKYDTHAPRDQILNREANHPLRIDLHRNIPSGTEDKGGCCSSSVCPSGQSPRGGSLVDVCSWVV